MLENIKNRLKNAFFKAKIVENEAASSNNQIKNEGKIYISTTRGKILPSEVLEKFAVEKSSKQIKAGRTWLTEHGLLSRIYNPYTFVKVISRMPLLSAGIDVIAEDVSSSSWSLLRKGEKEDKEEKKILEDFLNRPSGKKIDSLKDIIKYLVRSKLSLGDLGIEIVRTLGHKICEIYPTNTKNIYLTEEDEKDRERRYCQKYADKRAWFVPFDGKKIISCKYGKEGSYSLHARANELIYLQEANLESDYYGVPKWSSAIGSVLTWISAQEFNLSFFENNGVPSYAIILKSEKGSGAEWDDSVISKINKFIETELKGSGNAHRSMIMKLPNGCEAEFKALQVEQKEGSFILLCPELEKDVMASLHVPPYKLAVFTKAGSLSSDVVGRSLADYSSNTVEPLQSEMENLFNLLILPGVLGYDPIYRLKLADMSLLGLLEKVKAYTSLFGVGVLTPNQIIKSLNLGDVYPGGDLHYISRTFLPIEEVTKSVKKLRARESEMDERELRLIDAVTEFESGLEKVSQREEM